MHAIFLDEFGHAEAFDPKGGSGSFNPVFGYGGIVIPAGEIAAFATHFFDIKLHALRNELISTLNKNSAKEASILKHLEQLRGNEIEQDHKLRLLGAQMEVKGDKVFSRRFFMRQLFSSDGKTKFRHFLRFLSLFIGILKEYNAQIIFFGTEKACHSRENFKNPHLKFIKIALSQSFDHAYRNNSTVGLFFDHHQVDEPGEKSPKGDIGPRPKRIKEVVFSNHMYDLITEPVISLKSHESQCIQAADWVCYLLSQILPYYCNSKEWVRYKEFYEYVAKSVFDVTSPSSHFTTLRGKKTGLDFLQTEMPFPPKPFDRKMRPYRNGRQRNDN